MKTFDFALSTLNQIGGIVMYTWAVVDLLSGRFPEAAARFGFALCLFHVATLPPRQHAAQRAGEGDKP